MKRRCLLLVNQTTVGSLILRFTDGERSFHRDRYYIRGTSTVWRLSLPSQWQRLIELFTRGGNQRERERKNYDRGNEIITVGNQPKKKSKGYQRQGNERVELALGYKPKEEKLLMLQPTAGTSPAS